MANEERGAGSDPFILDEQAWRRFVPPPIREAGIADFRGHRVSRLTEIEGGFTVKARGDSGPAQTVKAVIAEDGRPLIDCRCREADRGVCRHGVAALLAYAASRPLSDAEVQGAAARAIDQRVKRGQKQVKVRHRSGDPWFGVWEASSTSKGASERSYEVKLRSVAERINYCPCRDYALNLLGTCKHIEAVLYKLKKQAPKKFARLSAKGPPVSVVNLSWEGPDAPQIRLRRARALAPELGALLDERFDGELLKGPLPQAFLDLEADLGGRDDLEIGEDAALHVRRLIEERRRRRRAEELSAEIRRRDGQLPGIAARLYPYQIDGVAFLASAGRALLADDMGLGKTLQALAAGAWLMKHEGVERILVVCPASLKHQWAREARRFLGLGAEVIQGGAGLREDQYRRGPKLAIANYELVIRDLPQILETLRPDLLILDEAQRIKNWRTKTAEAIKAIPSRFAFVLTGTPLENRLDDLYSLLQVIDGRVLGPLWRYSIEFHLFDAKERVIGYRRLSELRRRMAPVMLRRDRASVLDQLPERIDQRLDVALTAKQQHHHDKAMKAIGALSEQAARRPLTGGERKQLFAAMQKARMACNAAGLVDHKTKGSPKLDELRRLLEEVCVEGGRKAVVFSEWERMTAMAEEVVESVGLQAIRLHGGIPTRRRGYLIDTFREDPSFAVFIATDAGSVGLNLQVASVLINLDIPWNPAVLEQRIARLHRLGQKQPVQVIHLYAKDAYEEKVAALLSSKRRLFGAVIDPEAEGDFVQLGDDAEDALTQALTTGDLAEDGPEPDERSAALPRPPSGERLVEEPEARAEEAEALVAALGPALKALYRAPRGWLAVTDDLSAAAQPETERRVTWLEAGSAEALERLGFLDPEAALYRRAESEAAASPGWRAQARRRLEAAEGLIKQGQIEDAGELLRRLMLGLVARDLGLAGPPDAGRAAEWVFVELLGGGKITQGQALKLSRALSIGAGASLALATQVFDDASEMVERALRGA